MNDLELIDIMKELALVVKNIDIRLKAIEEKQLIEDLR
jgi:hypothetical protein